MVHLGPTTPAEVARFLLEKHHADIRDFKRWARRWVIGAVVVAVGGVLLAMAGFPLGVPLIAATSLCLSRHGYWVGRGDQAKLSPPTTPKE